MAVKPSNPLKTDIRTDISDVKLLPGETIINAFSIDKPLPDHPASALSELYALTRSAHGKEIGLKGPAFASKALEITEKQAELKLYETLFGRDSLRVVLNLLDIYPQLAKYTLIRLSELQGVEKNTAREEEPGKIIHEYRDPQTDPAAQKLTKLRGWDWPYYGSVDSTPQFIQTVYAYISRNPTRTDEAFFNHTYQGRDGKTHTIREAFDGAVRWLVGKLDSNTEGLLEFKPAFKGSIENQVWRDSPDAYHHTDGALANHNHGIASLEVQRIAYDALLHAAKIYGDLFDDADTAKDLIQRADNLHDQILELFWTDEKDGYFVLGLDRDEKNKPRQLKVRTSNMGHMLHSSSGLLMGIQPDIKHKREAVIRQLFCTDMLNISGTRTLAKNEVRFRPGAYHNGSVWPMDTNYIAEGLRRHNYLSLAAELEKRLLNIVVKTKQFPEYVRGGDDTTPTLNHRIIDVWDESNQFVNRIEQPPQEVQAWTVAAVLPIKRRLKANPNNPKPPTKFEESILKAIN